MVRRIGIPDLIDALGKVKGAYSLLLLTNESLIGVRDVYATESGFGRSKLPVVAAFHNVSAGALADLAHHLDCDVLVCGDDDWAKQRLFPLIRFIPGLRKLVDAVREASNGQTRLFIQLIDFLSIRRRPDPQKFFERFLRITDAHRAALNLPQDDEAAVRAALLQRWQASPEAVNHSMARDVHVGQTGDGGKNAVSQSSQRGRRSSPAATPSQYGCVSGVGTATTMKSASASRAASSVICRRPAARISSAESSPVRSCKRASSSMRDFERSNPIVGYTLPNSTASGKPT